MAVTATVVSLLFLIVAISAEKNRKQEFFLALKSEAVTKANLFLNGLVDAGVMHRIYMNNQEFLHEVEVAVYRSDFELVYHDTTGDIDIVEETPEMLAEIIEQRQVEFYQDDYQVVGFVYEFEGEDYILSAAAYDGYGYSKQYALISLIILTWMTGMVVLAVAGFFLFRDIGSE